MFILSFLLLRYGLRWILDYGFQHWSNRLSYKVWCFCDEKLVRLNCKHWKKIKKKLWAFRRLDLCAGYDKLGALTKLGFVKRGIPKKMCAKMLFYCFSLFTLIMSWIGVSAEEEVSSPLRVAQCRATCLQKVRKCAF